MNLSPQIAWEKSARLIKLCLGYSEDQDHKLRKIKQQYNDDSQRHIITLTLEVKHSPLVKGIDAIMYENKESQSLIQEINKMVD